MLLFLALALPPVLPEMGQPPAEDGLTLRTTTRLVNLTVVVRDRNGAPVRGLTAADFTVLDEGKPQQIRVFEAGQVPAAASTGAAIAARMKIPGPLPPSVFANFDPGAGVPPHAAVILLDGLSTSITDQRFARLQILKFLARLQPGDRVGLYALGRELRVLHDFTAGTGSLLKELSRYQGEIQAQPETTSDLAKLLDDRKLNDPGPGVFESMLDQIANEQQIQLANLEDRVRRTMGSLEAIAHHLSPVPGRKSLLWISAAFPAVVSTDIRTGTGSPSGFGELTDRAARALANSGVAVYPIDARGVMVPPEYRATVNYQQVNMARLLSRTRGRGGQRQNAQTVSNADPMIYNNRDETTAHHDVMAELAGRTGGRAYFYENDMGKAMREALDDAAASYTLAWAPSPYEDDGKYRKIRVRLKRSGLTALHREGYFAGDPKPGWNRKERESILELLASPIEAAAVPVAVQAQASGAGEARRIELMVRVDPAAVTLREDNGRWSGRLDVVMVYLDARGGSKGGAEEAVALSLTDEQRQQALGMGFDYRQSLPLPSGAQTLAIAVRDAPTGRVGTLRLELSRLGLTGPRDE
jgi:VWFA-related protein